MHFNELVEELRGALAQITARLAKRRYKFSGLVLEVVQTVPFQQRRGEADKLAAAEANPAR